MEVARAGDVLRLELDAQEAGLLRELLKEMRLLLEADIPESDAVIRRLFPAAHEDEEEQRAYQALVGDELHRVKLEAVRTMEAQLGVSGAFEGRLTAEQADDWLRALNDVRLAIGTRLGVEEGMMDQLPEPDHPDARALWVLDWAGWLQGRMVEELMSK